MPRPRGTIAGGVVASFVLAAALLLSPPVLLLFGFGATLLTVPATHLLLEEARDRGAVRRRCLAGLVGGALTTFVLGRLVALALPVAGDPARLLLDCVALLAGVVGGGLVVAGGYDRIRD
ncbi:hypothetical protein MBEHAL_1567 [Halarchaeum acidiphilum MH1-52-1]|uniref:Uncharacterized protein n=1 Tax=Halarchaeum acidiphilum MH1-52-1 TaxID=1261545 RepID=U2YVN3_9EURY|nr:hypothetical protein [Halarchaeum acidiphilum]GAD52807.1 hypothetical protein MBEHAL_1567 [Halarchaeum acidiphilum MH1-52-1]